MVVVYWLGRIIYALAGLYLLILTLRLILDWVQVFAPRWRPTGLILVIANILYRLTDPPLRALRRVIPPLRLASGFALDVGFLVLYIGVVMIQRLAGMLTYLG
ncbi:YggT family protein [Schaalia vaccimaxillae]|uniref:YggT family protein n=1 Tax=Schaalia vaccimaxillae TaxID=183916 RepID=UPI0003B752DB|nr:YggT family protein [Schaalia vaccimaxillae]